MQISRALYESIADQVATDTAILAAATAMNVHLIAEAFTPTLDTDFTALQEATFTGSAAKAAGTGAQQVFNDPTNGTRVLQILEPAGGWTWECTATPASAETIYGYALTDTANAVTHGTGLLPTPVTINLAGQGITLPNVRINFNPNGTS